MHARVPQTMPTLQGLTPQGSEWREGINSTVLPSDASVSEDPLHCFDAGKSGMASEDLVAPRCSNINARTANSWSSHFASHLTNCGWIVL
mmetsp:Transcript_94889/g.277440  ORF Transcript_94889/g.277440 Transcript_94889/m.277440 type:complete len:90 (+) Transcript_94889:41-310(+)